MAQLLLELFGEEIPARMQARAAADLERLMGERLASAGLEFDRARGFVTPRRVALVVDGLALAQADTTTEKRGPIVGAPEQAIAGFLKSVGLRREELTERQAGKGTHYFAVVHNKGRRTAEVLAEIIPAALAAVSWPKSMKWGARPLRWVRPLQRILCLFDGAVVPFEFGHLGTGDRTSGHRFLAPGTFAVADFDDYQARLAEAYVVLDPAERRQRISRRAEEAATALGLKVKNDPALIAENAGLVEWPVVLVGEIDRTFMEVPAEVLTTAMRNHQKYFALVTENGELAPRFMVVSNMVTADDGAIIAGNERVLRARLADAKFFWDQDRKRALESRAGDLANIVFHTKLGTLARKVERLQSLVSEIAAHVPGSQPDLARRAGLLSKADLTTEMVAEFPELQGIMGRYYARHDGEDEVVATAVADHYAPQGPNDRCPSAPVSVCLALADKLDTLVGFFAIGQTPTGSKDPFALRRAALGVIRLVLENRLRLPLRKIFQAATTLHNQGGERENEVLLAFFADRLKVHLREHGVRHDLISAVFASHRDDDLVRVLAKVAALEKFLAGDDGANLLIAYRRASNIVGIEEKRDGKTYSAEVNRDDLVAGEEFTLYDALGGAENSIALAEERYDDAMSGIAALRATVDAFFDKVTVNCPEPALRANRLRLLARIRTALDSVADFSRIEG